MKSIALINIDGQNPVSSGFRRFRPRLTSSFHDQLQGLAEKLAERHRFGPADISILEFEIKLAEKRHRSLAGLAADVSKQRGTLSYLAALRVLRDLLMQGWSISTDEEGILLWGPDLSGHAHEPEALKSAIRQSFLAIREAHLRKPSVRDFVKRMETYGIGRLFGHGPELAERLQSQGIEAIDPRIQLVESGSKDEFTGLYLQDIWRYARLYWSVPYQSTPGRNLFYLIRDLQGPNQPIIGIAAFGNPVLGLKKRDEAFGWTTLGLLQKIERVTSDQRDEFSTRVGARLFRSLEECLQDTYKTDLGVVWQPGVSPKPLIRYLDEVASSAFLERKDSAKPGERTGDYELIRRAQNEVARGLGDGVDWQAVSQTPLYVGKRAELLAGLIRSLSTLAKLGFTSEGGDLRCALDSEEGRRAVEFALKRIKQDVIAESVMELITCGALPPYNQVLGGKLVALLMLSRTVREDFKSRYQNSISLIASALQARPVRRPAELACITTTSLYPVASSQYNRIKVNVGGSSVGYKRLGVTKSFGLTQFAPDTADALQSYARLTTAGSRRVNSIFGEGASPKLREIRDGLDSLELSSDDFLKHHSPRLIYAAPTCSNFDRVALGLEENRDYVLRDASADADLILYWRRRWLIKRVSRVSTLESIRSQSFRDHQLGTSLEKAELKVTGGGLQEDLFTPKTRGRLAPNATFIERIYRSSKSYADRLSRDELDALNVDFGLENFLDARASDGDQIIITGNPGDGKTHLVERLRRNLEERNTEVITDANALEDSVILQRWMNCASSGKPLVLAINEWPLYVLRRNADAQGFPAVAEALRQVETGRFFVRGPEPPTRLHKVVAIDLSLRNLASDPIVTRVLDRLCDERFYRGLDAADPALTNRNALSRSQVRKRLSALLERSGFLLSHVTMRQLLGFLSFALTGGQGPGDRLVAAAQDRFHLHYSNLIYREGEGVLFDALRKNCDPAKLAHPDWDERLWSGATNEADWLYEKPSSVLSLPPAEQTAAFRSVKRRFFFEHADGLELLEALPRDDRQFLELLNGFQGDRVGTIRSLLLDINRFFEPDCPRDAHERLYLWQSHRFDVQAPNVFVVAHDVPDTNFRLEMESYAPWVDEWLPREQRLARSFALVAMDGNAAKAVLEIDRELFLTLRRGQRGFGNASWSHSATRRLTRFIDQLQRWQSSAPSSILDIRIRNVTTDLDGKFQVKREPPEYRL